MHAWLCTNPTGVDALTWTELPTPTPKAGEVLIEIKAASLNFPDLLIVQNKYQMKPPLPFVPGSEYAGVVAAVGDGVTHLKVGQNVACLSGTGGFGTHTIAPAALCMPLPDGFSHVDAAAFIMIYATSHHALVDRAQLKAGETVLILGAAGGVGTAAIQIAKAMGARVIAAASTDDKCKRCLQLGADAATKLGITRLEASPAILIGDDPYSVIGIISGAQRRRELLDAIVVPEGTAKARLGLEAPSSLIAETDVGAAGQVANQIPLALSPNDPDLVTATAGWEPSDVRRGVSEDVSALFLMLGGVALLVGMLGIANVTLVSVLERTGEIGLRRALGAGRRHIAAQFLTESALLGTLAGMVGSATGVVLTVVVAANRGWTPVLDPWLPLVAVLLGAAAGLLAGAYPAWRAARLEPVDALRSAT